MERRQYCVYNQTSECFLSLGVAIGDSMLERLKGLLGKNSNRIDEGTWIHRPGGLNTVGIFSSRDLIYLDDKYTVLYVIESFPSFQVAPVRSDATTMLALPVHTIYSSQTRPGNQLVICVAEEMEFHLRSMPPESAVEVAEEPEIEMYPALKSWLPRALSQDRRIASRRRWPRLVAYNAAGAALAVHGVRDISSTGLYLMTEERWPLGSQVRMSLQRTDGLDDMSMRPMTVQLRVARWGVDGVGLEFLQTEGEQQHALVAMRVH